MKKYIFMYFIVMHALLVSMNLSMTADELLIYAAINDDLVAAQQALEEAAYLDTQDFQGCTPVYYAAFYGQLGMLKFLLQRGANPNVKDTLGNYPLHKAIENNNLEAVKLLIEYDAYLYIEDSKGYTALTLAADKGYKALLIELLEAGVEPCLKNGLKTDRIDYLQKKNRKEALTIIQGYRQPSQEDRQVSIDLARRFLNMLRLVLPKIFKKIFKLKK